MPAWGGARLVREVSNDESSWEGWLREAELRVLYPDTVVGYYAELLGSAVADGAVVLGSSTQ